MMNCSEQDVINVFRGHTTVFLDYKHMGEPVKKGVPPVWANNKFVRKMLRENDFKIAKYPIVADKFLAHDVDPKLSYYVYGLFYFPRVLTVSIHDPYDDHDLFDNWKSIVKSIKKELTGRVDKDLIDKIRNEFGWPDILRQLRCGNLNWVEARHALGKIRSIKTRGVEKILQSFEEADRIHKQLMSKIEQKRRIQHVV